MTQRSATRIAELLSGRCVDVVTKEDLAKRLAGDRPLRVKLGIDPTGPQLHLGHAVVLRKLRQFQDLGHHAILIVGDFTAQIGDPSGRADARKPRTREEIVADMKTYAEQAALILDMDRAEFRYNSEWLGKLSFSDLIGLAGKVTVARMLERDDFSKRYFAQEPIGLHEFLYPIGMGYDSVAVKADVELGGTEQLFNLLMGRRLQEEHGQSPQICMTLPILEGTDGVQRMGKSLNNFIALREAPAQMFGKVMSLPDALLRRYWELATTADDAEVEKALALPPRDSKLLLAEAIVRLYHGQEVASDAREHFASTVMRKEIPEDMREYPLVVDAQPVTVVKVLVMSGLAGSNREGQRLIEQGAVKLDGARVDDPQQVEESWNGKVLQKGNHMFVRIVVPKR
ncbi:MAG TPA: tyrosine--tRNA ligase [Candidatus Eremiobacteraceae bacterium]|jgi:tyrosyl-tRNA synthetase|nr:tyrosine--tRNA ligase [Candidatus Eremiobacteraceae bacterium]